MRTRSPVAGISVLALLVAALAFAPSAARAAGPSKDCVRLVALNLEKVERSPLNELQEQAQGPRITGLMVDALGAKLGLGAAWKAGNPFWEEARALFLPELLAAMRAGAKREMRRMETKLPPLLDPAMCRKAVALLDSRTGAIAVRIDDAVEMKQALASFEKQFGIPASVKPRADAARKEIAESAALQDDPEVLRAEPKLAAAREEWRAYGKQYVAALRRLGDADPEVERKANQEASARMMAKNQQAFSDIVRRFRAAR